MGRILRFTLIGCGGLVALVVVFGVIGTIVGGGGAPPEQGSQGEKAVGEQAGEGEAAPEEPKETPKKEAPPEEEAEEAAQEEEEGGVVFRVTGDPGLKFQGSLTTMDISKSVQGVTPQDFPLKGVDTGMFSSDIVSCNAQKMAAGGGKLTVQIVVDGKVVKQANTTAQYGLAQVTWSPAE